MQLTIAEIRDGPHKVTLPESVIADLAIAGISAPLIFRLAASSGQFTHAGVVEFAAPEGAVFVGRALAAQLGVSRGDVLEITSAQLPRGSAVTLRVDAALDWKPLLEAWLPTNVAALTKGDELAVPYAGTQHRVEVVSLAPEDAVCILNADLDLNVEEPFEAAPAWSPAHASAGNRSGELLLGNRTALGSSPLLLPVETGMHLEFAVEGAAFVGPRYATSPDSYLWQLTRSEVITVPADVRGVLAVIGEGHVTVSATEGAAAGSDTETADTAACGHCHRRVPARTLPMHEAFCVRNNVLCETCGAVFLHTVPAEHAYTHAPAVCACGFEGDTAAVAHHRAGECPQRLIECQFCHLVLPQEEKTREAQAAGLTGHEAYCGNKTVDCEVCGRPVRQRELAAHAAEHDAARRAAAAPQLCANQNCPHLAAPDARLGLCATCYGGVYTGEHDPDGSKLRARIERRYVIQMTRGCGNAWCSNPYCLTGSGIVRRMAEVVPLLKELKAKPELWLCVDKVTAKKAMFLAAGEEYARAWRGAAISASATEAEAEQWLRVHAPRVGETAAA